MSDAPTRSRTVVTEMTSMDLIYSRCGECEHLSIYGFPHQVTWTRIDGGELFAMKCAKCGHEHDFVYTPPKNSMEVSNGAGI